MADEVSISDAEWQVMNVVWRDQPVESQRVIDEVAEPNGWSAATVKTMLHRLTKKGVLAFTRDGRRYLYRATLRREACVRRASRSFVERVFDGMTAPAVVHLVKSAKLSDQEIAELRRLLDDKGVKR